ncbi:MAG: hypothetical protein GC192_18085 [Bacteroidetes bacterium]|nr:hypothetical protein [Bacteroidota bacterium]
MKHVIALAILLLPLLLHSQRLPKPDALTIEDGLGFRKVTAVVQDSRGLMWLGTSQGLERYDGSQFVKFGSDWQADLPFPGEDVSEEAMILMGDTALWLIADGLLYSLDLRSYNWQNLSEKAGLKGNMHSLRKATDGTAWVVSDDDTQQYLWHYTGGLPFSKVASSPHLRMHFNAVACDPDGNVWWSTIADGLRLFNPQGELLHAVKPDSFIWNGTKMYFTPIFTDSKNRVFIFPKSTFQIWQYHPDERRIEVIADSLPTPAYFALEDSRGNSWFSTRSGLLRLATDGTLTDFSVAMRGVLQFSNSYHLCEDRTHLLWVATDNGLVRFPIGAQLFQNYLAVPGAVWGNAMRGMVEGKDGQIYAYCENGETGLHRLNPLTGERQRMMPFGDSLTNRAVMEGAKHFALDDKSNTLWTLTDKLLKINLETGKGTIAGDFRDVNDKIGHAPLTQLSDGNLLFGFELDKLTVFDTKANTSHRFFSQKQLDEAQIGAQIRTEVFLEEPKGNCWVGTVSDGLFCFNKQGEMLAHFNTKTKPALSKNHVLTLHLDKTNRLWVGTFGGGLNCLSGDLKNFEKWSNLVFTKNEGLSDNNVVSLLEDAESNIWAGTYSGLSCYRIGEGTFHNFFEEDGLTNNEFNYASAMKDAAGRLWFGGLNGLNVLDLKAVLNLEKNPPVCLTGFTQYDSRRDSTFVQVIGNQPFDRFIISPHIAWFQFNWALPNYFKPEKNHYYVRLDGLENDWTYLGGLAFVRYNRLPPGDYVLHVKASDSKGNWSESELAVPFTVRPFFYQTWWFYLLVLALVAAIAFGIARYRVQGLLEMERMRTRIASDLHDEVGSMLSGLAMQAELLEMSNNEKDVSRIRHIVEISRTAVSKMRDMVWSIDSRRDKLKNLLDRMQEQTADLLQPHDIQSSFELGELPLEKSLPVDIRQHLFLIFKEALNNVVRHSDASLVKVRFGNFDGQFELSIHDNGSHAVSTKTYTGLGLSNMEMRAKKLGGKLEVLHTDGFTVRLTMKAI